MRIPNTTYRVQFTSSFTFSDLKIALPYLHKLGITDIYASPIFKARIGSLHGYDITDYNQLNPELGTWDDFFDLQKARKELTMGWVQDFVPNHMAYDSQNIMLKDIFEHGEYSKYHDYLDIHWDHPYENMKNKLLCPILGKYYGQCLENGELQVIYKEGTLFFKYYNIEFPLLIKSYPRILCNDLSKLEKQIGGESSTYINYLGSVHFIEETSSKYEQEDIFDQIKHAKDMVWKLYLEQEIVKDFIDSNIRIFNGQELEDEDGKYDKIDELIYEQIFWPSFWRVADSEINYRRFFDINGLISVKIEKEEVFDHVHSLILKLIDDGHIDGIRIDHIDGLYDPANYLSRLRKLQPETYIVLEKILEDTEELPNEWPVQGTTGYDSLNYINGIFCQKKNTKQFNEIYHGFIRYNFKYKTRVLEKKRLIISEYIAGNVNNLLHQVKRISSKDRYGQDITFDSLRTTLVALLAGFSVYRTYINFDNMSEDDIHYITEAVSNAKKDRPEHEYQLEFLKKFLLLQHGDSLSDEAKYEWAHFVMSFQQQTGPIMAKCVEDTMFYLFNRLISLNEVGHNPEKFGHTLDEFHQMNSTRSKIFPFTFNALSTHDCKKGEDVRARINVLSEIPKKWEKAISSWSNLNRQKKKNKYSTPDRNDEYMLYQLLLGTMPHTGATKDYLERIEEYCIKASREGKTNSSWRKPNKKYEDGFISFVKEVVSLDQTGPFWSEFEELKTYVHFFGVFNSLSQTLLKMTLPGVSDFYQGSELWNLSLVDPDNRSLVDFPLLEKKLNEISKKEKKNLPQLLEELHKEMHSGEIKLYLVKKISHLRKTYPDLFLSGLYHPLKIEGKYQDNIVAYLRTKDKQAALIVSPRFLTDIVDVHQMPFGKEKWDDTRIIINDKLLGQIKSADHRLKGWSNILTKESFEYQNEIFVGDILNKFPVATLISS